MSNQQKINIRREVRSALRLLTAEEKARQSASVFAFLEKSPFFSVAETVLLFWSLPDEVCTHSFVEKWYAEKRILLPVVTGDDMVLKEFRGKRSMAEGAYGILEPTGAEFADYDAIDLAVVPGVAFTRGGARLGRGKGYYDRMLPNIKARKVGVCFAEQIVERIPIEPWDVKMDEVISGMCNV